MIVYHSALFCSPCYLKSKYVSCLTEPTTNISKLVCITPQDPASCARSSSCSVSPPELDLLSSYLSGAKIRRYAVVVTRAEWTGSFPAECPANPAAADSSFCGGAKCYVAMRREGSLEAPFDLGTDEIVGGCRNRKLDASKDGSPLTVVAVLEMQHGSSRNLVLVSKPSVVGGSYWWIVGIVVAVVVVLGLCAIFAVRRKRESKGVPVPTTDPEPNPLE